METEKVLVQGNETSLMFVTVGEQAFLVMHRATVPGRMVDHMVLALDEERLEDLKRTVLGL